LYAKFNEIVVYGRKYPELSLLNKKREREIEVKEEKQRVILQVWNKILAKGPTNVLEKYKGEVLEIYKTNLKCFDIDDEDISKSLMLRIENDYTDFTREINNLIQSNSTFPLLNPNSRSIMPHLLGFEDSFKNMILRIDMLSEANSRLNGVAPGIKNQMLRDMSQSLMPSKYTN
jgi:hypothetical protein